MPVFCVTVPVSGYYVIYVDAETETEAKHLAFAGFPDVNADFGKWDGELRDLEPYAEVTQGSAIHKEVLRMRVSKL